jgi:hypothetical protein
MARVVARARDAGDLRPDATADDVRVLFGGVCRMLGERAERDPEVWRRYARMVVAALRS